MGYPKRATGYYFYNQKDQKVIVSRNSIFLEDEYNLSDGKREIVLDEQSAEAEIVANKIKERDITEPTDESEKFITQEPRRRISEPPVRYGMINEIYQMQSKG